MTEEAHRAILKRIVGEARVALPSEAAHGAGKDEVAALRLEIARVARDVFGLTVIVESCRTERPSLNELQDEVASGALSLLLPGKDGRLGVAVYSADLALALLEWRLLGMLSEDAAPARPLTRTDASILADLTDPVLARFGAAVSAEAGGDWAAGYRQGAPIEDPRHVPLTLAAGRYHAFRVELLLGKGRRGGALYFALPDTRPASAPAAGEEKARPWPEALRAGVLGAELSITAVLTRLRLPATEVGRLRPGDCLPLPAAALASVRLEAPGGVPVAEGRLGQINGDRAVKIETGPADALGPRAASAAAPQAAPASQPMPPEEPAALGEPGALDEPAEMDFPAMADLPADLDFPVEPMSDDAELSLDPAGELPALS